MGSGLERAGTQAACHSNGLRNRKRHRPKTRNRLVMPVGKVHRRRYKAVQSSHRPQNLGTKACPRPTLPLMCAPRRGGRAVEGARLLSEYTVKSCIEGSNPFLSATNLLFWQAFYSSAGGVRTSPDTSGGCGRCAVRNLPTETRRLRQSRRRGRQSLLPRFWWYACLRHAAGRSVHPAVQVRRTVRPAGNPDQPMPR